MNSRNKGKAGEREVAKLIREHGYVARRGVQYEGGSDSPDVRAFGLPVPLHIEVKRTERLDLAAAFAQARRDAAGAFPTVWHRRSRQPWLVTLDAHDLLSILSLIPLDRQETGSGATISS